MIKLKHNVLFFCFFVLINATYSKSFPKAPKNPGKSVRLSFAPIVSFYSINLNHAKNPVQRMSGVFSFKKERRFGRDYKTFFLYGVEYFFHGISFQSYYFKADSLKLYDKNFAYKYSLFMHEIDIPLQVKYSFNRENNRLFSGYAVIGYHLRYLLPGTLKVTQNGNLIKADGLDLKFKTPFIDKKINSFLCVGLGWQKNNTASSKSGFFMELNYRYGFSLYYFESSYSATSLFMNGSHLSLQLGIKF
jgi:hypothetical protein